MTNLAASTDLSLDAQRVEDLYAEVCPLVMDAQLAEDIYNQASAWVSHALAAEENKLREALAEVYAAETALPYEEKALMLSEWDAQRVHLYLAGWHYNGINEDGYVLVRRAVK